MAIISGALFPLIFFAAPETAFVRSATLNNDFGDGDTFEKQQQSGQAVRRRASTKTAKDATVTDVSLANSDSSNSGASAKTSYAQSLMLFNGRKTEESYFKLLLRPFPLFLQPGVVWACITQGVMIGWTVLIGIVLSTFYQLPPLYYSDKKVGYLFSSAFIGSVVAFVLCGAIADPLAKFMTKKNGGVYEPEFRIPLVIFQLIAGCIGLYGFGWTVVDLERSVPNSYFFRRDMLTLEIY